MKYILALVVAILLTGCAVSEALNRPVDTTEASAKVAQLDQSLVDLREFIAVQADRLKQAEAYVLDLGTKLEAARLAAEHANSDAARAVVTGLENTLAIAQAGVPRLADALAIAEKQFPQVEAIVKTAHASLDDLKKGNGGGAVPLWVMLGTLALPWIPKAAALIPGVGPAVAPLAGVIADSLWTTLATNRQKAADAEALARSAALSHQVAVTHSLVAAAGDKAAPILKAAKAAQKADGVHATLEPLVAALEAKGF